MRAIEFKGRKKNSDEWFEGNLNKISGDWYIFPEDGHNSPDYYEVEESTISQFTGLLDKNGVKIWEGDVSERGLGEIFYDVRSASFKVRWLDPLWLSVRGGNPGYNNGEPIFENEFAWNIIGNIHDNPELLLKKTNQ